uniref:DNA repair metallo-beta-lactamase domain-containing protein n=1 Tax=Kalanchoe fedtschenkoi TaxID=63787 RepID=A0A7N0VMX7_KALFE
MAVDADGESAPSASSGSEVALNEDDVVDYPPPLLDENGFPIPDDPPINESGTESGVFVDGVVEMEAGDSEGFAADFYRCGSDWSSLLPSEGKRLGKRQGEAFPDCEGTERKMKQKDLFQMWGLSRKQQQTTAPAPIPGKRMKTVKPGETSADSAKPQSFSRRRKSSFGSSEGQPRSCPFYKKMPGTPFTVDAFRYGSIPECTGYFLSHFHSDHYGGLTKKWSHGPIYCTPITARLVQMCLYVDPRFICPLELDTEHVIEGVKVTFLEANHCPGAALIHFLLSNGKQYLHTGDFRASRMMQSYPLILNQKIDVLYLDTTYCNPKYKFPSKEEVLDFVVRITTNWLKKQPKALVAVGAYSIGKECVYLSISKALEVQIYANGSRRRILQSYGWPELSDNLCTSGKDTFLHVMPMSHLRFDTLNEYMKTFKGQYTSVLAFRPTGWTYSQKIGNQLDLIKPTSKGNITIYGVPYSEHSSFSELQEFVRGAY